MGSTVDQLLQKVRSRRQLPPPNECRQIRIDAGISLREVAAAVGVSHAAIVSWERGSRPRDSEHAASYSRLLTELQRSVLRERCEPASNRLGEGSGRRLIERTNGRGRARPPRPERDRPGSRPCASRTSPLRPAKASGRTNWMSKSGSVRQKNCCASFRRRFRTNETIACLLRVRRLGGAATSWCASRAPSRLQADGPLRERPPADGRRPEFAATFKVAGRETNTLSPVVRQAWDTGTLRTMTRNNPLTAKGAHISIAAHITAEELRRHLTSTEAANGFANRFMWILVRRSKKLPDGGDLASGVLDPPISRLRRALTTARTRGAMARTAAACALWYDAYDELSEGEPGLVGALLARSEAQVTRLSLIYALADSAPRIDRPHLEAALELWDYSARSVRHLFGDSTGDPDADTIENALRRDANGGLTRSEISGLFGRHASAQRIDRATGALLARGVAEPVREETGGRPVERWVLSLSSHGSHSQDWPTAPSEAAYHGPIGELVKLIEPHSEADPLAVLTQLLVAVGNTVETDPLRRRRSRPPLPQPLHRPSRRDSQGSQRNLVGLCAPREHSDRRGMGEPNHGRPLKRRRPHRTGKRTRKKRNKRMNPADPRTFFRPGRPHDPPLGVFPSPDGVTDLEGYRVCRRCWPPFPADARQPEALQSGVSASAAGEGAVGGVGAAVLRVVRPEVCAASVASAVLFAGVW